MTLSAESRAIAARMLVNFGDDPKRWCQRSSARNQDGFTVSALCRTATCHCITGGMRLAVDQIDSSDRMPAVRLEEAMIARLDGETSRASQASSVTAWNDAPGRTFAEVKAFLTLFA